MVPRLDEVLTTPDGRVVLAPPYITDDLPRLADRLDRPPDELVLVNRRHLQSNNSWMHNVPVLVKGKRPLHAAHPPDDAARCGLADGDVAEVASEAGRVEVPVEVTDDIAPGVVSLPHGWGHDRPGTRLSVAREHAGRQQQRAVAGHVRRRDLGQRRRQRHPGDRAGAESCSGVADAPRSGGLADHPPGAPRPSGRGRPPPARTRPPWRTLGGRRPRRGTPPPRAGGRGRPPGERRCRGAGAGWRGRRRSPRAAPRGRPPGGAASRRSARGPQRS